MKPSNPEAQGPTPLDRASGETGLEAEFLIRCIRAEWVIPAEPEGPALDPEDLARARLIHELMHDFGVNDEAVPIILHLLDQLYYLEHRVRHRSG